MNPMLVQEAQSCTTRNESQDCSLPDIVDVKQEPAALISSAVVPSPNLNHCSGTQVPMNMGHQGQTTLIGDTILNEMSLVSAVKQHALMQTSELVCNDLAMVSGIGRTCENFLFFPGSQDTAYASLRPQFENFIANANCQMAQFSQLPIAEQMSLLRSFAPDLILLSDIHRSLPFKDLVVLGDNRHAYFKPEVTVGCPRINFFMRKLIEDFIEPLRSINADSAEMSCLKNIAFWNPDACESAESKALVYKMRQMLLQSLQQYTSCKSEEYECRFGNLLMLGSSVRSLGHRMRDTILLSHSNRDFCADPFVDDILDHNRSLTSGPLALFVTSTKSQNFCSYVAMNPKQNVFVKKETFSDGCYTEL